MMLIPHLIKAARYCQRHLVAADPHQYEHLSNHSLVSLYYAHKQINFKHNQTLVNEIKKRLASDDISSDDREILSKLLENE